MVKIIARAFAWNQQIHDGMSMQQIATQENLGRSYVAHAIPLAFLAPDIVTAILDGRQPQDLKIKRLFKKLPMDWVEQRRVLGFPARL